MTSVLKKRKKFGQRHTRGRPSEESEHKRGDSPVVTDRDLSDTSLSQGMPRTASKHHKPEEERMNFLLQVSEGAWPY